MPDYEAPSSLPVDFAREEWRAGVTVCMFDPMRLLFPALVLGVSALVPSHARRSAGVLVVQVGDAASGKFIADAQVRLPSVGRVSRTKWDGEATFGGLSDGRYRVEVRAIGYAPGDVDVLLEGDSLPVHFNLERVPAGLDTVRVSAERTTRGLREFEERRKHGIGRFFTDSALANQRAKDVLTFLGEVPGFRIIAGRGVSRKLIYRDECLRIYLDGFELNRDIDIESLRLEEFGGVEIYSPATVPVQYRTHGSGSCAAVLFWTKW